MARKRGSRSNAYKWLGHIQVDFNDQEREEVLAYCEERTFDVADVIIAIVEVEIGFKITFSEDYCTYQCTLQPKGKGHYLRGYTVGVAHPNFTRLVQIAAYVVSELMENQGIELPGRKTPDDW